ncbi:MAG: hypothetical protein JO144_01780, partial [Actinobacteria bacterium]|nr:hypothetical protein [Actinomycetota bacterium]
RPVAEIFAEQGEPVFRQLEADMIAAALAGFDGVLALGGGAVTTGSVRADLAAAGVPVVALTAGPDKLLARLAGDAPRPLLAGNAPARLAELSAARTGWYDAVAGVSVETGGRTVAEVAALLHEQLTDGRLTGEQPSTEEPPEQLRTEEPAEQLRTEEPS